MSLVKDPVGINHHPAPEQLSARADHDLMAAAANGGNTQKWRFLVLKDRKVTEDEESK